MMPVHLSCYGSIVIFVIHCESLLQSSQVFGCQRIKNSLPIRVRKCRHLSEKFQFPIKYERMAYFQENCLGGPDRF